MTPTAVNEPHATNGVSSYGHEAVNGIVKQEKAEHRTTSRESSDHDLVLKTFRLLIADLCEQFSGGHPGGAIGMAAIGVALFKYVMRYAPHTPDFFNRDRFVLSNGHTCLFQYTFLHLLGYKAMTLEKLKGYHSSQVDTLCPGHPEIEHDGIEVTTGPLGQGVANAVGMAMATKHLAAEFNQPGYDMVSNHTWCMVGDACLQEGVGLEAISLAGHLRLNNLTVIYDNNQITCDGSVDLTNTEDINAKMRACGWEVLTIDDGCYDIDTIVAALEFAKKSTGRPVFINVKTIIGLGSAVAGDAVAHGAAFAKEDVVNMHRAYGFDSEKRYVIPQKVKDFFAEVPSRGEKHVKQWNKLLESYSEAHTKLAKDFKARLNGELPSDWKSLIPSSFPEKDTASRASSGLVFNPIAQNIKAFMVGTADLSPSVNMIWPDKEDFQSPEVRTECGINGSYKGRYIHWGVREHAMCAISNGLAAFHHHAPLHGSTGVWGDDGHQAIIPVTSSFFMFYIYAAPAVRMGALQSLQTIHVATHDSIGTGEDGPTHQPIELAALYRAMPNLLYIRPGDSEEAAGAWITAIEAKRTPTIISTSRHKLPQLAPKTSRDGVAKGAYVIEEVENADLTLIGVGAELSLAVKTAAKLREKGLKVRVVSFPCQRLFERQPVSYRRDTLKRNSGIPAIVIEPYTAMGWERYADAAICMSTDRYGQSLPGPAAYEYFGFEPEQLVPKVEGFLGDLKTGEILKGEFAELITRRVHGD